MLPFFVRHFTGDADPGTGRWRPRLGVAEDPKISLGTLGGMETGGRKRYWARLAKKTPAIALTAYHRQGTRIIGDCLSRLDLAGAQ